MSKKLKDIKEVFSMPELDMILDRGVRFIAEQQSTATATRKYKEYKRKYAELEMERAQYITGLSNRQTLLLQEANKDWLERSHTEYGKFLNTLSKL